ncbi:hypothetical protein [Nonomuraea jiangxiensis]|uniref:Uncharacterized protein n=1 Tax=Nonomuraea jiangxiensis TaxID=633440 RepID=A0A1G8RD94_9ACTN|nr:hypothetical protein [Nonomuraea jiangxiensis]SDJ14891.1 hypothetical protein SAMN05421869_10934 [Nonomuraea jiangxiensis]
MPHGDDLDARFNELVAQIDTEEQRKMRAAAKRGAKERDSGGEFGVSPGRHPGVADPYRRPRRAGRAWLAMAGITIMIAAAGLVVMYRPDLLAPMGPVPEETMPVMGAPLPDEPEPTEAAAATADPAAGPFAGSPAEDWAEGADGFVIPKAKALGGLSKKDVAKGLERTRELLAAAYLDKKTLLGGKPDAFYRLLHPDQRRWFRDGLDDKKDSTRSMVNSFAPKTAELATGVIKVKGRATLGTFKDKYGTRGVKVMLNHVIVYAVQRPGQPRTATRVATHAVNEVWIYDDDDGVTTWVWEFGASATPARCDVPDGFIHPVYEDSPQDKVGPTGIPVDPYDLDAKEPDGCQAAQET